MAINSMKKLLFSLLITMGMVSFAYGAKSSKNHVESSEHSFVKYSSVAAVGVGFVLSKAFSGEPLHYTILLGACGFYAAKRCNKQAILLNKKSEKTMSDRWKIFGWAGLGFWTNSIGMACGWSILAQVAPYASPSITQATKRLSNFPAQKPIRGLD